MSLDDRLRERGLTDITLIKQTLTSSTNTDCRQHLTRHAPTPVLITADRQTGGRGRQGKSFESPAGGLYMSLGVRSDLPIAQTVRITTAASVAVCRAIQSVCGLSCGVKWVNDVYCNGKKLCGILTEGVNNYGTGITDDLILGVGINLISFPEGMNATSVLAETGREVDRDALCAAVCAELLSVLDCVRRGDYGYMEEYRRRSVVIGREVLCIRGGNTTPAHAVDIDDEGGLCVRYPDGSEETLRSGEITLRFAD